MLYSVSKIPTTMVCHAGMQLTRNETAYQVVSFSLSKFTFHVVYYQQPCSNKVRQIIGQTLVCVSIHLECWLGKSRVETVTCVAVGVACQQQFSYNLVINFGSVNAIDVDSIRIRCTSGECKFNSHSNRIQCEKALNLYALPVATQRKQNIVNQALGFPDTSEYYRSFVSKNEPRTRGRHCQDGQLLSVRTSSLTALYDVLHLCAFLTMQ